MGTKRAYSKVGVDNQGLVSASFYNSWKAKVLTFLGMFLTEDNEYMSTLKELKKNMYSNASAGVQILENIKDYIEKGYISMVKEGAISVDDTLMLIFDRFHKVARQLRNRHEKRATLKIEDEYDVQDLLHALLQLYFNDIRAEEWTPSYAGKSARVDFLLKNEKTVIEIKKTRNGLEDKEIGDQLIIDVGRYKIHPDCEKLVCFVYDSEGRIGNPEGIMNDLNSQYGGFAKVIIRPNS